MNKYQEALNHLKDETIENFKKKHVQTYEERAEIINDVIFLRELVDKATPQKPKEQLIDNSCRGIPGETPSEKEPNYFCSNCNELVGDEGFKYNYCPNCGQAIDWSTYK